MLAGCAPAGDILGPSPRLLPPDIDLGPAGRLAVGQQPPRGALQRWTFADTTAFGWPNLITSSPIYVTSSAPPDSIRRLQISLDDHKKVRCVIIDLAPTFIFTELQASYTRRLGKPRAEWHDGLTYYATWADAYVVWNIAGGPFPSSPGTVMVTVAVRDPAQDPGSATYDPEC